MFNITVICLGKLKEAYLEAACKEYGKRLKAFCKLSIIELTPKALPDAPSDAQIKQALELESKEIRSKIPKQAHVIALCIEGKMLSSETFSRMFTDIAVSGKGELCFVIGSSHGLDQMLKEKSDFKLSMSPMTFPHQLARVMLLEQIYRAFMIDRGGKYHK